VYIYFRQLPRVPMDSQVEEDGTYQMLTVLNAGASTFQINGLEKFAIYQIFLLPFYKNVEGRPSNWINVTTLEDGKEIHKCFISYGSFMCIPDDVERCLIFIFGIFVL